MRMTPNPFRDVEKHFRQNWKTYQSIKYTVEDVSSICQCTGCPMCSKWPQYATIRPCWLHQESGNGKHRNWDVAQCFLCKHCRAGRQEKQAWQATDKQSWQAQTWHAKSSADKLGDSADSDRAASAAYDGKNDKADAAEIAQIKAESKAWCKENADLGNRVDTLAQKFEQLKLWCEKYKADKDDKDGKLVEEIAKLKAWCDRMAEKAEEDDKSHKDDKDDKAGKDDKADKVDKDDKADKDDTLEEIERLKLWCEKYKADNDDKDRKLLEEFGELKALCEKYKVDKCDGLLERIDKLTAWCTAEEATAKTRHSLVEMAMQDIDERFVKIEKRLDDLEARKIKSPNESLDSTDLAV